MSLLGLSERPPTSPVYIIISQIWSWLSKCSNLSLSRWICCNLIINKNIYFVMSRISQFQLFHSTICKKGILPSRRLGLEHDVYWDIYVDIRMKYFCWSLIAPKCHSPLEWSFSITIKKVVFNILKMNLCVAVTGRAKNKRFQCDFAKFNHSESKMIYNV